MPRKAIGDRPLTAAERQARQRARNAARTVYLHMALQRVIKARTIHEARRIAATALEYGSDA